MTTFQLHPRMLENNFNNIFNTLFNQVDLQSCPSDLSKNKVFKPNVNFTEDDDLIALTFELPGMEKSEIKVLVKDNVLTVSGDRKIETHIQEDVCLRSEILTGSFKRSFNLPDTIKQDSVNADYKNGLLHIVLAKKEESKPKEIEVSIS